MVIFSETPLDFSTAETFKIEFSSISQVTSIQGTPLGAGGIPFKENCPRLLQSLVSFLSPSKIWIKTPGWLSTAVVKVQLFLTGIVVPLGISTVITPPMVSIPRDKGVASKTTMSSNPLSWVPESTAAQTAAPQAIASSGLMSLDGSFPLKNCLTSSTIFGILVDPPTKTTSYTWAFPIAASFKTCSTGPMHYLNIERQSSSNLGLVIVVTKS